MPASSIEERRSSYAGAKTRELFVVGDGPIVLMVHGFGHSADTWRPVLRLLHMAGQAAVAIDLPGFGRAAELGGGPLLSQLDVFLAAVIRHHGRTNSVVLVGNSLGAALAVRAARDKTLPVAAVMALGVAGVSYKPMISAAAAPIGVALRMLSGFALSQRVYQTILGCVTAHLLYGDRSAIDPDVVERLSESYADMQTGRRMVALSRRFRAELDATHQHGGVVIPMIAIHGARDRLVPVSASRILQQANPGSELVVLKRAGHCPQLDAAGVVVSRACGLAHASIDKEIS